MRVERGKRIAIIAVGLGLVIALVAGLTVLKRRIGEDRYIGQLKTGTSIERETAIEQLGKMRSVRAITPLIEIYREKNGEITVDLRVWKALAEIGTPGIPVLTKALQDENVRVRECAVLALAYMGPIAAEAVPAIFEASKNEDIDDIAIAALEHFGQAAIPGLQAELRGKDVESRARAVLVIGRVLKRIGSADETTLRALAGSLRDENDVVQIWAAAVLARVGKSAMPVLCEALRAEEESVRMAAVSGLQEIGRPAVPALIEALNEKEPRVRGAAAWALGWIGPEAAEAKAALSFALGDSDEDVRTKSKYALEKIQGESHSASEGREIPHRD
jgi:HEAT repeat protein